MTDRKWMLCGLLAAIPCFCAINSARAADPATPAPDKSTKTLFIDDAPGPKVLIRTGDGASAAFPDGPVIAGGRRIQIPVPPGAGPGQFAVPAPPGGPGRDMIYIQRSGADGGFPTPPNLPEGAKVFISRGHGPDGMPGPEPQVIGTFRAGGGPTWLSDPEMERLMEADASLDRESRELAEQLHRAANDKQSDIKKKLEEVVTQQFDARQQRRMLELKHLEDEIKRIQSSIEKRNDAKKQIVDRRINEVLGQDDTSF